MKEVIVELEKYLNSKEGDYTGLEIYIERLLEDYKKVKEDLKLKNEIIIKLAVKGL